MCRTTALGAAVCCAVAACAHAGPIAPPAGPVAPTHKTLTEVEPRTAINAANTPGNASATYIIDEPGSYYLAEILMGEPGKTGIDVYASDVTLDLNGFTLQGVAGSLDGIRAGVGVSSNITIRNGAVRDWGHNGVKLNTTPNPTDVLVEHLLVRDNNNTGILVGDQSLVRNCRAAGNGAYGIVGGDSCVIEHVEADSNGFAGIQAGDYAIIGNCTSSNNSFGGIAAGARAAIDRCVASSNTGVGISAQAYSTVRDSEAHENTGSGIDVVNRSLVSACTAEFNGETGISGTIVAECSTMLNGSSGIQLTGSGVVRGCRCDADATGIDIGGNYSIVEANVVRGCPGDGIAALGVAHLVVRNTAINNGTNYNLSATTAYGPIVSMPAGSLLGIADADHPQANFQR